MRTVCRNAETVIIRSAPPRAQVLAKKSLSTQHASPYSPTVALNAFDLKTAGLLGTTAGYLPNFDAGTASKSSRDSSNSGAGLRREHAMALRPGSRCVIRSEITATRTQ